MKPETRLYLQKAREFLTKAETLSDLKLWSEEVGRAAYFAGFHAAQAALFETTNKVFKTHNGVRSEFGRLTANDPRFSRDVRAFLGRTYGLKTGADYETGADERVTEAQAAEAIAAARLFVTEVADILGG